MPLSDQEKYLLTDFLSQMDDGRLKGLSGSVTMGRINCDSREEALNCILLHATSIRDLFNLKRISTTVLLNYLYRLNESVPGTATKEVLIQRIYQKWNLPFPTESPYSQTIVSPAPSIYPPAINYQNLAPPMGTVPCSTMVPNNQFQMMSDAARVFSTPNAHDPLAQMIRSRNLLKEVNSLAFNEYIVGFAQTFYNLLNNASGQYQHSFNDTHFFGECKLKIMIKGAEEDIELEGEGIVEVLTVLSDLKKEHQLYFSPNLTEQGVRSKRDSHGLISAVVCGTLHQRSGPVGVFEQCFIISPDPFARESYKIQETVLILRSSNAVASYSALMLGSKSSATPAIMEPYTSKKNNILQLEFHSEC